MRTILLILATLVFASLQGCGGRKSPGSTIPSEPQRVSLCELDREPLRYEGQLLEVGGQVSAVPGRMWLEAGGCPGARVAVEGSTDLAHTQREDEFLAAVGSTIRDPTKRVLARLRGSFAYHAGTAEPLRLVNAEVVEFQIARETPAGVPPN